MLARSSFLRRRAQQVSGRKALFVNEGFTIRI
jgi:hypothetical protein